MSSPAWTLEGREGVAVLWFDLPGKGQNVLTTATLTEFDGILQRLPAGLTGLVVASRKAGSFIAGADIAEIDGIDSEAVGAEKARAGQRVLQRLACLPLPTAAAVGGFCLGGGCELALACTYRVAGISPKTLIGLPETKLGILPGFGGTQRLPRLVGLRQSVDLILSGRLLDARQALKIGLVDRAVSPQLVLDAALEILRTRPAPARPRLGAADRLLETAPGRIFLLRQALAMAEKKAHGAYPAVPAVIDVLRRTAGLRPGPGGVAEAGLEIEAEAFGRLVRTDVSANLRALYFLDEESKRFVPVKAEPLPIRRAGVLGAGVMGGGIAWAFSSRGVPVRVKDIREEALAGALRAADGIYRGDLKRRAIQPCAAAQGMARISTGLDFAGFGAADIVVEAVVERMDVKKKALAEAEAAMRPDAVLATNTSGLSIDEMARALAHPERFGGLHFFNPVNRMPLVEVIRGAATSDATVATLFAAARLLGKKPILVRDSPGFLVNRILIPYMLEAARILEEGVRFEEVDRAAERFGMPMGPCRLADEVGIDIGLHVADHLAASFGDRMAVPASLRRMVEAGLLGRKTARGFFVYTRGKKGKEETSPNPGIDAIVRGGASPHHLSDGDIQDRLFLTMLLEAVRCLEDGVVARVEDIEIGMIFGTGFPPFRGGLVRWARSLGEAEIRRRAAPLAERHGIRFSPPDSLRGVLAR